MSVTEKAEIPIVEGREDEFEALLPKALPIIRAAAGCNDVRVARGIENPGTFLLLVEWETVDAHVACTKTPEFAEFVSLVKPFFAGPSGMAHWNFLDV